MSSAGRARALTPLHGQGVLGPLPDQPPLELGEGGHDIGDHLAGRRRGVHAEVEGDEGPTLCPCALHEAGEVEERARQAVELGDDEGVRCTAPDGLQRLAQGRPAGERLPAGAGVLECLDQVPAPAGVFGFDGVSLGLEPESRCGLLVGGDPDVAHHALRSAPGGCAHALGILNVRIVFDRASVGRLGGPWGRGEGLVPGRQGALEPAHQGDGLGVGGVELAGVDGVKKPAQGRSRLLDGLTVQWPARGDAGILVAGEPVVWDLICLRPAYEIVIVNDFMAVRAGWPSRSPSP